MSESAPVSEQMTLHRYAMPPYVEHYRCPVGAGVVPEVAAGDRVV